jgi:hypothetical protein
MDRFARIGRFGLKMHASDARNRTDAFAPVPHDLPGTHVMPAPGQQFGVKPDDTRGAGERKMNRKLFYTLIRVAGVISIIAMSSNVVFAGWDEKRNYVLIKTGMYQPTGDLDRAGYDTGLNAGAAYGRYLNRYLVLETSLDFSAMDQKLRGTNATAGNYSREDTIGVISILATLKAEYTVGPVSLFAGAGVGGYLMGLNSEVTTGNLGEFKVDDQDHVFGAHVVAGGRHTIGKNFFVGVEGSYRWTQDVDIKKTTGTVPVEYTGNLNGYTVAILGGYRF